MCSSIGGVSRAGVDGVAVLNWRRNDDMNTTHAASVDTDYRSGRLLFPTVILIPSAAAFAGLFKK